MKRLKQFGAAVLYWFIAMNLYYVFRYFGLPEEHGIEVSEDVIRMNDNFFFVSILAGVIFGFFHFLVQLITSTSRFKRKSFGQTLVIRGFLYLVTLIITGNVLVTTSETLFSAVIVVDPLIKTKGFWSFALFFTLMSSLYIFFEIVSEKFGRGVLMKMLLGSYRTPKEENRIFMFLDLKSSTTIAENLGHFEYSKLIQQCFYDLNEVAAKYDGEIYQYVGDEVVISWPYERGVKDNNCIDCFFDFQRKLESKRAYYEENFEILPEFKAGLHGGKLIVTEVGIMKKEIAYHGDVINTAARIQGECNKYNEKFLISENLLDKLNIIELKLKPLGEVALKGKLVPVKVVAVS